MSRNSLRSSLFTLLMIFVLGAPLLAGSAGPQPVQNGLKRLRLPEGPGRSQSLWVWNLGDQPTDVRLGAGQVLHVAAGSFREAPEPRSGQITVSGDSQIVLVAASRGFDPNALEIDLRGTVRQEDSVQGPYVQVTRPAWARQLLVQAARRSSLAPGQTFPAAAETGQDGRARLAVGLVDPDSAVVVTLKDARGTEIRSFSVAAPMAVRLRIDLGPADELGETGTEVKVVRGRAVVGATAHSGLTRGGIQLKTTPNGTASASSNLVFSGSYTFSVSGGPASTCGELDIYRNGTWEFTPGWLCTNSSGNATMGPWNWSDKASDETGDPIFIRWPDNSATTDTYIIVDKNPAYTYEDSYTPTNATPTSYYGHATDATWGTGFDFGYASFSVYQNLTTGKYWDPATGLYSSNSYISVPLSYVSESNRWYVSWYANYPSVSAHTTGQQYRWYTCFSDAQSGYCTGASPYGWTPYEFTAN